MGRSVRRFTPLAIRSGPGIRSQTCSRQATKAARVCYHVIPISLDQGLQPIHDRLLDTPHIRNHRTRLEVRSNRRGHGHHRSDRNTQNHQIGIAHRGRHVGCRPIHNAGRLGSRDDAILADQSPHGIGQTPGPQGQAQRPSQKSDTEDGDFAKRHGLIKAD